MKPIIRALAWAIVIAATAGSAVFFIRSSARIPVDEAERVAKGIAAGVEHLLHLRPEVKIDRTTVIGPAREVLELTTLKNDSEHAYNWTNTWGGSTKIIRLKGRFTASYGIDLRDSLQFDINSKDLTVNVVLPEMNAKLLAFEMNTYQVEEESSGWWNWLTKEERNQAVLDMMAGARQSMQDSETLCQQSKHSLKSQLSELIQAVGGKPGTFNLPAPSSTPPM